MLREQRREHRGVGLAGEPVFVGGVREFLVAVQQLHEIAMRRARRLARSRGRERVGLVEGVIEFTHLLGRKLAVVELEKSATVVGELVGHIGQQRRIRRHRAAIVGGIASAGGDYCYRERKKKSGPAQTGPPYRFQERTTTPF